MKWFKERKENAINGLAYLLQHIFIKSRSSWGAFIIDANGNIIEGPYEDE